MPKYHRTFCSECRGYTLFEEGICMRCPEDTMGLEVDDEREIRNHILEQYPLRFRTYTDYASHGGGDANE